METKEKLELLKNNLELSARQAAMIAICQRLSRESVPRDDLSEFFTEGGKLFYRAIFEVADGKDADKVLN